MEQDRVDLSEEIFLEFNIQVDYIELRRYD